MTLAKNENNNLFIKIDKDMLMPCPPSKKDKLNIVHINTFDKGGGAAKIAFQLMEEQNRKGHDAKLLVGLKKSDNSNVFQIPFIHSRWRKYFKRATELLQWQGLLEFDSLFISRMNIIKSADVIHLHNLHGDYFSLFTSQTNERTEPKV